MENELTRFSASLADVVERTGRSVVRVDDGTRLTASGVAWADDLVVATAHGVEADENLLVEEYDGKRLVATLVGRDEGADLAVLRIEGGGLTPFVRAEARIGALALAVARPADRGLQATLGLVSGAGEFGPGMVLSTDATMYPGFSGGALIDAAGGLLGVLTLGWGRGRGVALATGLVAETVDAILGGGSVRRGYLGVRTQPAELPGGGLGLLVAHVEEGGPAQAAGLALGDVILRLDGRTTDDPRRLRRSLRGLREGQDVAVDVLRGGAPQTLRVTLGAG